MVTGRPSGPRQRRAACSRTARATGAAVALLALLAGLFAGPPASAATRAPALPTSMAAVGDSISVAYDVNWAHALRTAPEYSWSTGTKASVAAHYRRLVAARPALAGHAYHLARPGARMADLDGQLRVAAALRVQYVTVLVGANDLCRDSVADLTPAADFERQFVAAMGRFSRANPRAVVLVVSIPDVTRLWRALHGRWTPQHVWDTFGICPVVLSSRATDADRAAVAARATRYGEALQRVCARTPRCRYDGGATSRYAFGAEQVSPVDWFHPNAAGQAALASLTWSAGWWPDL